MNRAHIIFKDDIVILCNIKCVMNGMVETSDISLVYIPVSDGDKLLCSRFEDMLIKSNIIWSTSLFSLSEVKSIHYIDEEKYKIHYDEIQKEIKLQELNTLQESVGGE